MKMIAPGALEDGFAGLCRSNANETLGAVEYALLLRSGIIRTEKIRIRGDIFETPTALCSYSSGYPL
jgi:hypothetical protein